MPDRQQGRQVRRFASSCRFVFNKVLTLQKLGYAGLCKLLAEWRNSTDTAWLADAPAYPLQQILKDLERAHGNYFAKCADFPRFKWNGGHLISSPCRCRGCTCPCYAISLRTTDRPKPARMCRMWFRGKCRSERRDQCLRIGHARLACKVSGVVMPLATGTHRRDSLRLDTGMSAVGIPDL
jgi:hypothetical protein